MTVLVTGGAGFIGSHLCEVLLKEGHKVLNIDSFNDFYNPQIKRENVSDTIKTLNEENIPENNYVLYEGDIRDFNFLDKVFSSEKIEVVIHIASYAGVRPSIEKPLLYADVNINGTLNLLELCRKHNIKRFIFASSSSVYGNNEKFPFSEADIVDFPISPYAATKKAGELLCHTYHSLYNINTACLRFFTVFGPRQRPDLAINKFTYLIMEDKEVPFYGDGTTERDYTFIEDIINGVKKSIEWVSSGIGKYEVFNLGSGNSINLNRVIKTLEETLGKKAKLKMLPMQPGDVMRTLADISKAKEILGYQTKTEFKAGIKKYVSSIMAKKQPRY